MSVGTPKLRVWDGPADTETVWLRATTAVTVAAQNAELAQGVESVAAPSAGAEGRAAICCAQPAASPNRTWSHTSGRPIGESWPISSSVAMSLRNETFMRAQEYSTATSACCYPDYRLLLKQALRHSRQLFGYSYPRDRWYVRLVVTLDNLRRAVARNPFRTAVHSVPAMEEVITAQGFRRTHRSTSLAWVVDVYVRDTA